MTGQDSGAASGSRLDERYVRELEARVAELDRRLATCAVLHALTEQSRDQLAYLDRDFNFVFVNPAYEAAARKSAKELVGKNHFEVYPHPENEAVFERVRDTGVPAVWREKPFTFPDQPERGVTYWDWTLTPKKDPTGVVTGLVLALREVTDEVRARHELEESERRFRLMADGAPSIIWVTDAEGNVRFVNRSYREFFGVTYEEVEGGKWRPLVHPDDAPGLAREVSRGVRERVAFRVEARGRDAGGEWRWLDNHAEPRFSSSGEFLGHVGISVDVTERRKAEAALRRSEERLRLALDAAQAATWEWNPVTGETFWSEKLWGLYGLDPHACEPSYEAWQRVIYPDDREGVLRAVEEARRTGSDVSTEWRVVHPDGAERWLMSRGQPTRDKSGAVVSYIGIAIDITERKRIEQALGESESRFRSLFENMFDACAHFSVPPDDCDLIFVDVNESARRLTGHIDLVGRRVTEVFPGLRELHPELIDAAVRVARTGEPVRLESYFQPLAKWLAFSGYRPKEGHCVAVVHDITERKTAEVEREKLVEALRETDRRKNQFIAVLSHELRNPLAPIKNSLYVLDRAAPGGDQARRAQAVIHRQVDQLSRLVDDLLDITRISRDKIQLQRERVELGDLVRRTIEDHRSEFDAAGVRLELLPAPEPVWVNADRNRLAQVVGNLLQNAKKFTRRGGSATVSLGRDKAEQQAVIRVVDTGVGMTPEMLERAFQPFMQADVTLDRAGGGLGLGLALVKGLVELHGGGVVAKSDGLGKGAEIIVRLPLELSAPADAPSAAAEPERVKRHVLVIEDNVDAAETLRDALELSGHAVAVAYDGLEGLAKARELSPRVVLCDIGLPGMDGFAVARAFRADAALRNTYLVALSGYALPDDVRRAKEAGFDRHLAKPPSLEQLEDLLGIVPT